MSLGTWTDPHRFAARHSFGVHRAALQVYQLAILATSIVSVPTYHINQFWAEGCGLGWTVKKKGLGYEQLLRPFF